MNCPRCRESTLDERERDGVVIDVCRACKGLWLDRGELEKLIARAAQDFDESTPPAGHEIPRSAVGRDGGYRGDHDDDDDDRYRRGPQRKRGWFSSLGDLFD
jgi:uncharacterized protein